MKTQKAPKCTITKGERWCSELRKLDYGAARERNKGDKTTESSEVGKATESERENGKRSEGSKGMKNRKERKDRKITKEIR